MSAPKQIQVFSEKLIDERSFLPEGGAISRPKRNSIMTDNVMTIPDFD